MQIPSKIVGGLNVIEKFPVNYLLLAMCYVIAINKTMQDFVADSFLTESDFWPFYHFIPSNWIFVVINTVGNNCIQPKSPLKEVKNS